MNKKIKVFSTVKNTLEKLCKANTTVNYYDDIGKLAHASYQNRSCVFYFICMKKEKRKIKKLFLRLKKCD